MHHAGTSVRTSEGMLRIEKVQNKVFHLSHVHYFSCLDCSMAGRKIKDFAPEVLRCNVFQLPKHGQYVSYEALRLGILDICRQAGDPESGFTCRLGINSKFKESFSMFLQQRNFLRRKVQK